MAGNTLYLGNLFNSLNGKIDQQIAKVDQQITKLDSMITELVNVKNAVSQNVSAVYTKVGTGKTMQLLNPERTVSSNGGRGEAFRFTPFCDGDFTISGTLSTTRAGNSYFGIGGRLQYSMDGGTTYLDVPNGGFPYEPPSPYTATSTFSSVLTATKGKTIIISMLCNSGGGNGYAGCYLKCPANTFSVTYDIKDIINQGAFTNAV